jgi:hypothetical protein
MHERAFRGVDPFKAVHNCKYDMHHKMNIILKSFRNLLEVIKGTQTNETIFIMYIPVFNNFLVTVANKFVSISTRDLNKNDRKPKTKKQKKG